MKVKTKLIASIMSICLVCAVFAIGVFALKTANLKIGGDVSFSATGVEAHIKNATLSNTVADDGDGIVLATGSINTSMTQTNIDTTFQNWQTLELDFDENATDIELKFDIANTSTNSGHFIEMDYTYSFNNENPNVDVVPGYYDNNGQYVNNEYILAPKGATPADGDYQTFRLNFIVLDKELNVPDNTKVNLTIKLKHHNITDATDIGGAYAYNGLVYYFSDGELALGGEEKGSLEVVDISPVIKIGENYHYVRSIGAGMMSSDITTSVSIPASVKSLYSGSFYSYSKLENLSIAKSVINLGDYAFLDTPWYNNQPDGEVYINNILHKYKGTMPENTKIKVKEGTINLSSDAFKNCTNLIEISLPHSLLSIGKNAFSGCTNLTSVKFEETTGWWYASSSTATSGTELTLSETDFAANANLLKSTYCEKYWFRTVE